MPVQPERTAARGGAARPLANEPPAARRLRISLARHGRDAILRRPRLNDIKLVNVGLFALARFGAAGWAHPQDEAIGVHCATRPW